MTSLNLWGRGALLRNRNAVLCFLFIIAFLNGFISPLAHARRAYFLGTITYNDSGSDAMNSRGAGWCYNWGAGNYVGCYKLYNCNITVSNLSPVSQKITGYSMSIINFTTTQAAAVAAGVNPDSEDPFFLANGSGNTWFGWTTKVSWASGAAGPSYILYKYTHTSSSSSLTPAGGYTAAGDFSLAAGETAVLTFGSYGWVMGGILNPTIYNGDGAVGGANYPFKEFMSCYGYIDVEDSVATTPGFVVASGVMDSKAGSYINGPVSYGAKLNSLAGTIRDGVTSGDATTLARVIGKYGVSGATNGAFSACGGTVQAAALGAPLQTASVDTFLTNGGWGGATTATTVSSDAETLCSDSQPWDAAYTNRPYNYPAPGPYSTIWSPVNNDPFNYYCSFLTSDVTAGTSAGSVNADWPEITFNTPIVVNGGSPF